MGEAARSILLAGVTGSVQRHQKLDDAESARALERCLKRIERAVELFAGRLAQVAGNEALALFARPEEAVRAAQEMQQRVAELPPQGGVKLAIRVGVAHGAFAEGEEGISGPSGEALSAAAQLAGLARPGQILADPATRRLLPEALLPLTRQSSERPGAEPVFEIFASRAERGAQRALRLHYGGRTIQLDAPRTTITIGRDANSDVKIGDRRASRRHATIERRAELFWLIDHSSNGSYVTLNGQTEVFVHAREFALHGSGVICFAASASSAAADCAQFAIDD